VASEGKEDKGAVSPIGPGQYAAVVRNLASDLVSAALAGKQHVSVCYSIGVSATTDA
jgi:hypothetical protein